ncbi:hypothetical protein CCP3SC1_1260008 [Gammaproteobacteria bacterium]
MLKINVITKWYRDGENRPLSSPALKGEVSREQRTIRLESEQAQQREQTAQLGWQRALREKDAALQEKDAALQEKDAALQEKDAALQREFIAMKEKEMAMQRAAEAAEKVEVVVRQLHRRGLGTKEIAQIIGMVETEVEVLSESMGLNT